MASIFDLLEQQGVPKEAQSAAAATGRAALESGVISLPQAVASLGIGPVSPEQMEGDIDTELADTVKDFANLPIFRQAKQSIKEQEDLIDLIAKQPVQTDFTPVFSLIDSLTGSSLAKTARRPESVTERAALLNSLKGKIQNQRQNLMNSLMSTALKQQTAEAKALKEFKKQKEKAKQGDFKAGNFARQIKNDLTRKSGVIGTFRENKSDVERLQDILRTGTKKALERASGILIKLAEQGRVSNEDVRRALATTIQGFQADIETFLNSDEAKAPPKIMERFVQHANSLARLARQDAIESLETERKSVESFAGELVDVGGIFDPFQERVNSLREMSLSEVEGFKEEKEGKKKLSATQLIRMSDEELDKIEEDLGIK